MIAAREAAEDAARSAEERAAREKAAEEERGARGRGGGGRRRRRFGRRRGVGGRAASPSRSAAASAVPSTPPATPKACDHYRLDMTGATFGDCKCGRPKAEHLASAFSPAGKGPRKGPPKAGGNNAFAMRLAAFDGPESSVTMRHPTSKPVDRRLQQFHKGVSKQVEEAVVDAIVTHAPSPSAAAAPSPRQWAGTGRRRRFPRAGRRRLPRARRPPPPAAAAPAKAAAWRARRPQGATPKACDHYRLDMSASRFGG